MSNTDLYNINLPDDKIACSAMNAWMQSKQGRETVYKMLRATGVDPYFGDSTFTGNALSGSFAQGYQACGLMLKHFVVKSSSELFLLMLKENQPDV